MVTDEDEEDGSLRAERESALAGPLTAGFSPITPICG
jgi:hypothetical protein